MVLSFYENLNQKREETMRIAATQYNLNTRALEIYVSGCKIHCKGCHNPELQDFNLGDPYEDVKENILTKIKDFDNLIDKVWVLGGEPLNQEENQLINMLSDLIETNKPIWLFTGYDLSEVPEKIKAYIDYLKYGKYDETKRTEGYIKYGVELVSSNQNLIKL